MLRISKTRHRGLDQIILSRQLGSMPEKKAMKMIALGTYLAALAPRKSRIGFSKLGIHIVFDERTNEFEVCAETTQYGKGGRHSTT